ncbi:DUF3558 domain-containing protein [Kibdelosporangium persicum]|uniref:DUF3558 domain-containing protein n=1 Tax=Kibdelosporangium persicum TaxID=2698649 RepID=UPI001567C27C|nr:DUF3558 domain-containing protein [Kibdelosporangium persicum]
MVDRRQRSLPGACCVLTAGLLAFTGCAEKTQGTATAATQPSTSTVERHGAPSVRQPLDVTRFLPQPCTILAAAQLRKLDLPGPGVPDTDSRNAKAVGPSCTWRNSGAASSLGVTFVTANTNGLADRYRAHAAGLIPGYWLETTVDGYPAVYNDDLDDRARGLCMMDLGVSDHLTMLVDVQDRSGEKSCDRVAVIASMVISTLRGQK